MPATFYWLGGDAKDPDSWQAPEGYEGQTPWEGDDLYFDGAVASPGAN